MRRGVLSSLQDSIYALGKANVRFIPSLTRLPSVAFATSSSVALVWPWPFLVLSRNIVRRFLFLRLSPLGDRWCDALGSVPAGSVSTAPNLRSPETKATGVGCFARKSVCSVISHDSGVFRILYILRCLRRCMSNIVACQSWLPIPLFTFCSKLIGFVRIMACVVSLSPLETFQR